MSSQTQILSKLAATRKIIKSKFQRAYMDRMNRERKMDEIMKPITSTIVKVCGKKKRENGEKNDHFESIPFKPKRKGTSTPKSILHKKNRFKAYATENEKSETPSTSKQGKSDDGERSDSSGKSSDKNTPLFTKVERSTLKKFQLHSAEVQKRRREAKGRRAEINRLNNLPQTVLDYKYDGDKEEEIEEGLDRSSRTRNRSKSQSSGIASRTRSVSRKNMKKGSGLKASSKLLGFNFIPYNARNHIIYEYFDDPNELCERLRLLVSSRMAGNTNHMQEINSIIEELQELDYII